MRTESLPRDLRIGILEVGSRAVRLMVADFSSSVTFKAVRTASHNHGIEISTVTRADIVALSLIIDAYRAELIANGCDRILIYGTAMCRQMPTDLRAALPSYLEVLTPEKEALGSWAAGIMSVPDLSVEGHFVVIDQGDGSTEIVTATWSGHTACDLRADSIPIGMQAIMAQYKASPTIYSQMMTGLTQTAGPIFDRHKSDFSTKLYLVGSVATKIAWLRIRKSEDDFYKPHLVNGRPITVQQIFAERKKIERMHSIDPERARRYVDARPGSEDEPVRLLSGSPYIMLAALRMGFQDMYVSGYGVRHGMAFLLMRNLLPV